MPNLELSASLLAANCLSLGQQVQTLLSPSCQIDRLHVDAMDGAWVPHLFPGALLTRALRDAGITVPIDIHLMVDCVATQIEASIDAGATTIWFHPEVVAPEAVADHLNDMRQAGVQAGLVLGLDCTWEQVAHWAPMVDDWLILTVKPGACGQAFGRSAFEQIVSIQTGLEQSGHSARLSVDGGINVQHAQHLAKLGVDALVIGSALFDEQGQVSIEACQQLRGVCYES